MAESCWDGSLYQETAQLQTAWADRFFFDQFSPEGSERILDLGCGDGRHSVQAASLLSDGYVLGVDLSGSMITVARDRHCLGGKLRFEVADAADPTFFGPLAGQFDVVLSFATLLWVDDQLAALSNIRHVLADDGRAYLTLASDGFDPQQEVANTLARTRRWRRHFSNFEDPIRRFSLEEYALLLARAGLEPIELVEREYIDILPNRVALRRQAKSWLPHYRHLPEELREQFMDDFMDALLVYIDQDTEGRIFLTDSWLEVVCRKASPGY